MQKIKNLALLTVVTLLLFSCSQYNKVLNKGTTEDQYAMATKMYEAKKYGKALRLFEKITPVYRGKPQMERIQFMVAQSNFNLKDYNLAGYHFDRFTKNYPSSSKREEASFLSAYSYKLDSPVFSLEQTQTHKAIDSYQYFINTYPESERIEEANLHYIELRLKLQKKAFENAKTYYTTAETDSRNYKASIQAFDNMLEDFLGSEYKEEVLFYRLKAAHDYVLKSRDRRKEVRIKDALAAYDKLIRNFPNTQYLVESNEMLATLNKEKEQLQEEVKS